MVSRIPVTLLPKAGREERASGIALELRQRLGARDVTLEETPAGDVLRVDVTLDTEYELAEDIVRRTLDEIAAEWRDVYEIEPL